MRSSSPLARARARAQVRAAAKRHPLDGTQPSDQGSGAVPLPAAKSQCHAEHSTAPSSSTHLICAMVRRTSKLPVRACQHHRRLHVRKRGSVHTASRSFPPCLVRQTVKLLTLAGLFAVAMSVQIDEAALTPQRSQTPPNKGVSSAVRVKDVSTKNHRVLQSSLSQRCSLDPPVVLQQDCYIGAFDAPIQVSSGVATMEGAASAGALITVGNGDPNGRTFEVSGGAELVLRGLKLIESCIPATEDNNKGAVILAQGTGTRVNITRSWLDASSCTPSSARDGGAIALEGGAALVMTHSTISGGNVLHNGGAIFLTSTSSAIIASSHITSNSANVSGNMLPNLAGWRLISACCPFAPVGAAVPPSISQLPPHATIPLTC